MKRRLLLVVTALLLCPGGCSKSDPKKTPPTATEGKTPASPLATKTPAGAARPVVKGKPAADEKVVTCSEDQVATSTKERRVCKADRECAVSCQYGALTRTWYDRLGPGCKDGCEGMPRRDVKCVEGTCQVFFEKDGKRDDGCSDAPAPAVVCVDKAK